MNCYLLCCSHDLHRFVRNCVMKLDRLPATDSVNLWLQSAEPPVVSIWIKLMHDSMSLNDQTEKRTNCR
jgi:hypothetical protein